jgi:hypothetical protein
MWVQLVYVLNLQRAKHIFYATSINIDKKHVASKTVRTYYALF